MDNKQQDYNLFSHPMTDGYSEMTSKPSAQQKNITKLTLFHDLLHNSDNQSLHFGTTTDDHCQQDSCPSDCESGISGSDSRVDRICEGDKILEAIKKKFVSSLASYGFLAKVMTIKRNDYCSCIMGRVKIRSFCLYSRGIEIKRNGNANVKYAWFGASKEELHSILSHGFGLPPDTGLYGRGVYLSPVDRPIESMHSSIADENGLRHMLLCRVILGNMEVVRPGSAQCNPSSEEFDSGVDNLVSPKKYIVWNGNMNTHILPEFVVSFRASSYSRGCQKISKPLRTPSSDWMPFATLVHDLSKFLPHDTIKLIAKHRCDYRKQKITRQEMIHQLRQLAGDKLLVAVIKSHRQKIKGSWSSSSSSYIIS